MAAFTYRMPSGIPGTVNRAEHLTVEPGLLLAGFLPTAFGVPLAIDAATGRYRAIIGTDTVANVGGVLVRSYPSNSLGGTDGFGFAGTFNTTTIASIMKRGYIMMVIGGVAAAAKGGTVFVRIAVPSAGKPIGGFEAASDTVNTIAMPSSWYFMGPADAQGNCEAAINI